MEGPGRGSEQHQVKVGLVYGVHSAARRKQVAVVLFSWLLSPGPDLPEESSLAQQIQGFLLLISFLQHSYVVINVINPSCWIMLRVTQQMCSLKMPVHKHVYYHDA